MVDYQEHQVILNEVYINYDCTVTVLLKIISRND